jgi:hypothetical protein
MNWTSGSVSATMSAEKTVPHNVPRWKGTDVQRGN